MGEPLAVHHVSVPVSHGQILVNDPEEGDIAGLEDAMDDGVDSGRFVGSASGVILIVTPAADSSGTPVTVEEWANEPADDRDGWDHEVDIDIDVPSGELEIFLTTGFLDDGTIALTRPGPRRLRVSARFAATADGDTTDFYRLRTWPRTRDAPPRLRRAWPHWPQLGQ